MMDMEIDDNELASVEIVFAQKLACGEPPVRQKALVALQQWIKKTSKKQAFSESDMMRLCKGLHYVMWMQDQMIMQEELAEKIAGLLAVFPTEEQKALYFITVWKCLGSEWKSVDRWRMDKFLMLLRRLLRSAFSHLASRKWADTPRNLFLQTFVNNILVSGDSLPDGLKYHFAAVYLDELDMAGGLTQDQVSSMIQPFYNLLSQKTTKQLFETIVKEIFEPILCQYANTIIETEGLESRTELPPYAVAKMDERLAGKEALKFDYAEMGKQLFDVGKKAEVAPDRRKRLYELSRRFQLAAQGKNPYEAAEAEPSDELTEAEVKAAIARVIEQEEKDKEERKSAKKVLKKKKMSLKTGASLPKVAAGTDMQSKIRKNMFKQRIQFQKTYQKTNPLGKVRKGPKGPRYNASTKKGGKSKLRTHLSKIPNPN